MADTFYKPQTPLHIKDKFIYPLTTADQVIKSDGSRLEENGLIIADKINNKELILPTIPSNTVGAIWIE